MKYDFEDPDEINENKNENINMFESKINNNLGQ